MKKEIPWDFSYRFPRIIKLVFVLFAAALFSCQPDDSDLGRDIFPPGDNIIVHYDSLEGMNSYPITGRPFISSENPRSPANGRMFLLGNIRDTISGFSKADIVTQFNPTNSFIYGPNMVVDSVVLYLYIVESESEDILPANIRIHELTEPVYMDSVYYSDYDITNKYNPEPLVEKKITPVDSTMFEFLIEDQAFIDKFISPPNDTLFSYDSLFKDYFNGLYITSDEVADGGFLSKVHLAKSTVRLSVKYANDSTAIDTIEGLNYKWSNFLINEYTSQKINIYEHDHTGTSFESIIDDPDSESEILYVQGLNGVNTKLHLDVENWFDSGIVAINSAILEFEVVPDSISGISVDDLPDRLILITELDDNSSEPIYDYVVDPAKFDGNLYPVSEGVFFDTTYVYRFNIGLHYQNLINGAIENRDLILQPYGPKTENEFVKLWSNYYTNEGSLRLKIIYTKLK